MKLTTQISVHAVHQLKPKTTQISIHAAHQLKPAHQSRLTTCHLVRWNSWTWQILNRTKKNLLRKFVTITSVRSCYHILAVRMFVGLLIDDCYSEVSLKSLSKRSLKRSDKKSGRKRPRKNDVGTSITPAPDSLHEEMKKTPKSKKKLRFMSPFEEHPFHHQST